MTGDYPRCARCGSFTWRESDLDGDTIVCLSGHRYDLPDPEPATDWRELARKIVPLYALPGDRRGRVA